jgi:hypothetical protein
MADLLDIAPSTAVDVVKIDGHRIIVRSLSVDVMASIISRFPVLKSIASGNADDIIARLIETCGTALGPIIAAGCGHHGDEQYEQRAASLLPDQQIKFLNAILRVTFPNGISSFLDQLTHLVGWASGGAPEKPVRMRSRKLPSPSQLSSDAGSHPTMQ